MSDPPLALRISNGRWIDWRKESRRWESDRMVNAKNEEMGERMGKRIGGTRRNTQNSGALYAAA